MSICISSPPKNLRDRLQQFSSKCTIRVIVIHTPCGIKAYRGRSTSLKHYRRSVRLYLHPIRLSFMKLLFVCSRNRLRSPTAEAVFAEYEGLEVDSAGLDREAEIPLSSDAIQWADIIFVMEKSHRSKLSKNFQSWLKHKRVVCLDIPDEYEYMEPALIELMKARVLPLLGTF